MTQNFDGEVRMSIRSISVTPLLNSLLAHDVMTNSCRGAIRAAMSLTPKKPSTREAPPSQNASSLSRHIPRDRGQRVRAPIARVKRLYNTARRVWKIWAKSSRFA